MSQVTSKEAFAAKAASRCTQRPRQRTTTSPKRRKVINTVETLIVALNKRHAKRRTKYDREIDYLSEENEMLAHHLQLLEVQQIRLYKMLQDCASDL
jgi:cell division protein FtsB